MLLRARAIENQAFVLAPNQVGEAPPHYDSYGHSAIVDPWGVVLASAPDEECFVAADLDLAAQERVRESLPSLANRRPEAYAWPQLDGGARLMASKAPPDRQAPPDPRRGDPRLRPPGLPRDPRLRHRRRGRRRLRPRLPLLQLQGRGAERALHRALVAAAGGDRGGRRAGRCRRARSSTRVAGFIVDSYRHDPELMKVIIVEVTRAANSFGRTHLPEIRRAYDVDRQDRRRRPGGGRLPRATSTPTFASMSFYGAIEQLLSGWIFEVIPASDTDFDAGKGACRRDDLRRPRAAIGKVAERYG